MKSLYCMTQSTFGVEDGNHYIAFGIKHAEDNSILFDDISTNREIVETMVHILNQREVPTEKAKDVIDCMVSMDARYLNLTMSLCR